MGSKPPSSAPEGSEVRPLTQEELRKELEGLKKIIDDTYALLLTSAYDLGWIMLRLPSIEEKLRDLTSDEDLEDIRERLNMVNNDLKGISLALIHLSRKLVAKDE